MFESLSEIMLHDDSSLYQPGKLYTLDPAMITWMDSAFNIEDMKIVEAIAQYIQKTNTLNRIVFTTEFDTLCIVAGKHWVKAAQILNIKHIKGWYVKGYSVADEDFILSPDSDLISMDEYSQPS
jgi:hypothetical protein